MVGIVEAAKGALKCTVAEGEEKASKHFQELEELRAKLIQMEICIRQLILERGELNKKNRDLEAQVKATEGDNASIKQLIHDTKRYTETIKTRHPEEATSAQSFE